MVVSRQFLGRVPDTGRMVFFSMKNEHRVRRASSLPGGLAVAEWRADDDIAPEAVSCKGENEITRRMPVAPITPNLKLYDFRLASRWL